MSQPKPFWGTQGQDTVSGSTHFCESESVQSWAYFQPRQKEPKETLFCPTIHSISLYLIKEILSFCF